MIYKVLNGNEKVTNIVKKGIIAVNAKKIDRNSRSKL